MKFSYDESYLPLKKNLTKPTYPKDNAGRNEAEHSAVQAEGNAASADSSRRQTGE